VRFEPERGVGQTPECYLQAFSPAAGTRVKKMFVFDLDGVRGALLGASDGLPAARDRERRA
jgi:hypothetical protein